EAGRDDEYLLGKNILVAPVLQGSMQIAPDEQMKTPGSSRVAWIPPGDWLNVWNGETISGPAIVTNQVPLDQIPLFIRSGVMLPLAPEMQFTWEKPWSPVMLDLYPRAGETNTANLYEDDTLTTAYQRGEFRNTPITMLADD